MMSSIQDKNRLDSQSGFSRGTYHVILTFTVKLVLLRCVAKLVSLHVCVYTVKHSLLNDPSGIDGGFFSILNELIWLQSHKKHSAILIT